MRKLFIFTCLLGLAQTSLAQIQHPDVIVEEAQKGGPSNNHLFYHIDLNYGNIYSMAISSIVTGYVNYAMHETLFENGLTYDVYHGQLNGENIKYREFSPMGIRAREMFNTVNPGFKFGYRSDNDLSNFNWGVFAMGSYKLDQFELRDPGQEAYMRHRLQYVKAGGGVHLTWGKLLSPRRLIVEAGLQYSIPIGYRGYSHDKAQFNKGLTSHFAVKWGGPAYLQNIGLFADFDHFNTFDKSYTVDGVQPHANNTLRNFSVGLQCIVTFMQTYQRK